jgi:bifunctional DNA-binding transcriptional regulator/antitoxin component of YhaV-PrlF toxin-antitoxin module
MRHDNPYIPADAIEAVVSSKGQVTLPKALRVHLGILTGSRIRFSLAPRGGFHGDRILYELEDLWRRADQGPRPKGVMSFKEMDEAKARRDW